MFRHYEDNRTPCYTAFVAPQTTERIEHSTDLTENLFVIRYIEYETSMDELMKLRKATKGIKANIGKGEVGCVKRCHVLYDRATKKFKGDLRLWLNWLEFCRASNSPRQMSKVALDFSQIAVKLQAKLSLLWSLTFSQPTAMLAMPSLVGAKA